MKEVGEVLSSSNGIPVLLIVVVSVIVLLLFAKLGFFRFKGKGLVVGKTENELRAILLKQKEFIHQYFSCITQEILANLEKMGIDSTYVQVNFVVEKVIDQWLGWMLVNHISDNEHYVNLKIEQSKMIMTKALGLVNRSLLQDTELMEYLNKECERASIEVIKGILEIYKLEN